MLKTVLGVVICGLALFFVIAVIISLFGGWVGSPTAAILLIVSLGVAGWWFHRRSKVKGEASRSGAATPAP